MSDRPAPTVPARIFITGANGFIGKALAARLRELGAEVTGVDLVGDPAQRHRRGHDDGPRLCGPMRSPAWTRSCTPLRS